MYTFFKHYYRQYQSLNSQRGISLIIVFFIMVIVLAIVLSISTILINEIAVVRDIGNSVSSFYVADHGIEKILYYDQQAIPQGGSRGFCNICNACPVNNSDPSINCTGCWYVGPDCNPTTCNNCQVSFGSSATNQSSQVSAQVSPNSSDPTISYFSANAIGLYGGAAREMIFNNTNAIVYNPPPPPSSNNCQVAYWKLDEDPTTPGFSIYDSAGNNNWGTPHGPAGVNNLPQPSTDVPLGFPGTSRSLGFDGTDDSVDFGNSAVLNPTTAISVAFWIKTDSFSSGSFGNNWWHIYVQPYASKIEWVTYDGSNLDDLLASINIADDLWHQITVVWESGNDKKKIYLDGVQVAVGTHAGALSSNLSTVIFRFGRSGANSTSNALMDDIHVYNCALTPAQIQDLQVPGTDVNPIIGNNNDGAGNAGGNGNGNGNGGNGGGGNSKK